MEPALLRAILARTPGLRGPQLRALDPELLSRPDAVRAALARDSLTARARRWLEHPDRRLIDADLQWLKANQGQIVTCLDPLWPSTLSASVDPATLYLVGPSAALNRPTVAVVGARQPSPTAVGIAQEFARGLVQAGVSVLGGQNDGIERAAHEAVLTMPDATITVCVAGPDRVRTKGCVVSAFPPGTAPQRFHFPLRNRRLASLAAAVVAIEALPDTAAWRIVEAARLRGRPIYAIPGSIRDPLARGCHRLIREGATLVQQPRDILDELQLSKNQEVENTAAPGVTPAGAASPLDNKYEMLLDAAGFEPVDIDVLAFRTGWSGHAVASMLLLLELQGRVAPQPGGRYCRLS